MARQWLTTSGGAATTVFLFDTAEGRASSGPAVHPGAETMVMPEDDTYHGERWRYGLTLRPITQYMNSRDLETDEKIPWILFSRRTSDDPRFRTFGTFDCAAELSPFTCRQFSLVPLGMVDDGSGDEEGAA